MESTARLLAAIGAALLGNQGSPTWSRTAESLLLTSAEVCWHYRRAEREIERFLEDTGDSAKRRAIGDETDSVDRA
jgi:hypothetical protein